MLFTQGGDCAESFDNLVLTHTRYFQSYVADGNGSYVWGKSSRN